MIDNWKERIHKVLGIDDERCARNAERWRTHLIKELPLPLSVTGIEDFPWEERYVMGGWDKLEYEQLKKTNPSYTDVFELVDIAPPDNHDDLVATIKRLSDNKVFLLRLSWLRTLKNKEPDYTTLNDYSVWHCNY
jgi:hypothetical protein